MTTRAVTAPKTVPITAPGASEWDSDGDDEVVGNGGAVVFGVAVSLLPRRQDVSEPFCTKNGADKFVTPTLNVSTKYHPSGTSTLSHVNS